MQRKNTDALELLANGINPSANKKAMRVARSGELANSLEVVSREWASDFFVNKKASHKDRTLRRLEGYVSPWLGDKPISDVTASQVLEVVNHIKDLNKLETAHRTLQALSQVFGYAVRTGRALRNPCVDLRGLCNFQPSNTRQLLQSLKT